MNHTSKTRAVALVITALVAIAATTASGSDASTGSDSKTDPTSSSADSTGTTGTTVSKGVGSSDASADVTDPTILREGDADLQNVSAQVTITNNSSKPSDYFVTVVAESPDHKTRYDDTVVSVNALDPGQSTTEKGLFLKEIPADAVVRVTQVQRTASL